jgi:hypothetical protein
VTFGAAAILPGVRPPAAAFRILGVVLWALAGLCLLFWRD